MQSHVIPLKLTGAESLLSTLSAFVPSMLLFCKGHLILKSNPVFQKKCGLLNKMVSSKFILNPTTEHGFILKVE